MFPLKIIHEAENDISIVHVEWLLNNSIWFKSNCFLVSFIRAYLVNNTMEKKINLKIASALSAFQMRANRFHARSTSSATFLSLYYYSWFLRQFFDAFELFIRQLFQATTWISNFHIFLRLEDENSRRFVEKLLSFVWLCLHANGIVWGKRQLPLIP